MGGDIVEIGGAIEDAPGDPAVPDAIATGWAQAPRVALKQLLQNRWGFLAIMFCSSKFRNGVEFSNCTVFVHLTFWNSFK